MQTQAADVVSDVYGQTKAVTVAQLRAPREPVGRRKRDLQFDVLLHYTLFTMIARCIAGNACSGLRFFTATRAIPGIDV